MKPLRSLIFILLSLFLCGDIAAQNIFKRAKKSTERETNKKVDEGIKKIFNPKKKKKEKESAEAKKETSESSQTESVEGKAEQPATAGNKQDQSTNPTEELEPKPAPEPEKPEMTIIAKSSDFVPGTIVLFEDEVAGEQLGEFPSKWDLESGTIEVAQFGDQQVIAFMNSKSTILPLMDEEEYLPEQFTIEMDCYFQGEGNEGYYINFYNSQTIRINRNNVQYAGSTTKSKILGLEAGWRNVAISFNKRALKVYMNGERLINIPNVKEAPKRVKFSALSHGASKGKPAAFRNIRIAQGAVPLYDKLLTDGKFVTNEILFEIDSDVLKPESMKIIDRVVQVMEKHKEINFRIEGHTDSDGSDSHNLDLSERRAASVKKAIAEKGINSNRMSTMGFGESKPIVANNSDENKAQNRRVEFIVVK